MRRYLGDVSAERRGAIPELGTWRSARLPTKVSRPSDQGASRRCPTGAGHRKRGDASAEHTRRARKDDAANGARARDPTRQAVDDLLTRIASEQQRQRQHRRRRQLERDTDARDDNHDGRREDAESQPKREVRTSTVCRHAREYTGHCSADVNLPSARREDSVRSP